MSVQSSGFRPAPSVSASVCASASKSESASVSESVSESVSVSASAPARVSVVTGATPAQAAGRGRGREPVASPVHVADPVRELMHRHRELCAQAVDPLEIAAALEAEGATDRVAARYRHRDVFSLAEELFARVPRAEGRCFHAAGTAGTAGTAGAADSTDVTDATGTVGKGAGRATPRVLLPLLAVLPGVLCAGAVAVAASAASAASGVPAASAPSPGPARTGVAVAAGLACALAPAVWCARWFAVRAGRRLEVSRSLDEFASGMRPLLTAAVVLFTGALTGLLLAARGVIAFAVPRSAVPSAELLPVVTALGVLLFAALLLAVHGFRRAAASGLLAACALQAAAALAAGSPAGSPAGLPAELPAGSASPYAVAAACGCAVLYLLACAYRLLSRASAHLTRAESGSGPGRRRERRRRREPCESREPREPRACREHCDHCDHCDHCAHCEPPESPGGRAL